jgi:hypothetical protein
MKGGNEMRKKYLVLLACSAVLASILLTPTLIAEGAFWGGPRRWKKCDGGVIHVSGEWKYVSVGKDMRSGGGYTFVLGEETGTWTGSFTGTSHDYFQAVKHPSGDVYLSYGLIFFEGTVEGRTGTMVINFAPGEKVDEVWSGRWQILSGTDELENIRGRGYWRGPSFDLDYYGKICFDIG